MGSYKQGISMATLLRTAFRVLGTLRRTADGLPSKVHRTCMGLGSQQRFDRNVLTESLFWSFGSHWDGGREFVWDTISQQKPFQGGDIQKVKPFLVY